MRNWLKTLLFLSAFSPALVSVALARFWERGFSCDVAYYGIAGILGASATGIIIAGIKRYGEVINFRAKKIESNDALMLGMIGTYFIPFLGKAADITVSVVLVLLIVVAAVLWVSSSILPHPLLRALSFRFYKVESETGIVYTLITQRELLDPRDVKTVKRISSPTSTPQSKIQR